MNDYRSEIGRSQHFFALFFLPQKHEDPGGCQGLLTSLINVQRYSFKELGSEVFLGDFRLR
jgi:hypothetical protein